jgi:hypothetical protein
MLALKMCSNESCWALCYFIGTQTLGGVFVRSMKITTTQETSVSEMYSAASSRLTATSSEASQTTFDSTARAGLFGGGVR